MRPVADFEGDAGVGDHGVDDGAAVAGDGDVGVVCFCFAFCPGADGPEVEVVRAVVYEFYCVCGGDEVGEEEGGGRDEGGGMHGGRRGSK